MKFPVFSLLAGNFAFRDGFARDCLLQQRVYELSVPERRTLNDKCRGAIVIITHRGCTRTI
jgi:hypothetical protein